MAKTHIRESNAAKCIYASLCVKDADPGEDGPFDSVCKDPKAQLQAILKGGGGVGLAFKLMKTDLNRCVKIFYVAEKACWSWYTNEIEKNKVATRWSGIQHQDGEWVAAREALVGHDGAARAP